MKSRIPTQATLPGLGPTSAAVGPAMDPLKNVNRGTSTIASDQVVAQWDAPFRLFAGPGAGKTHWLANHISHIVRNSARLHGLARVACISYTNVATERILHALHRTLGPSASSCEVSTIHCFLYRTLVAPYIRLIRDPDTGDPLLPAHLLNGHDEHHPAHDKVERWLKASGSTGWGTFKDRKQDVYEALKYLAWRLEDNELVLRSMKKPPVKYLPTTKLESYKRLYWREGILDHEDVLYFAYRLISEHPSLASFVAAAYPYVFIDEFQDTNPLQTGVLKALSRAGAVVGVVGDRRQAIYRFNGASPEDFDTFHVDGQFDYVIAGNRRSTRTIIALLNHVRGDDLVQDAHRCEAGEPVQILVGPLDRVLGEVRSLLAPHGPPVVLTRSNEAAAAVRMAAGIGESSAWSELDNIDADRSRLARCWAEGYIHMERGSFALAANVLHRGVRVKAGCLRTPFLFKGVVTDLDRRGLAVLMLAALSEQRDHIRQKTLLQVYEMLSGVVATALGGEGLQRVSSKGRFHDFATATGFGMLIDTITVVEDARSVRTVHKAKGDEFDHVLCIFDEAALLKTLCGASSGSAHTEEDNIRYVALSRARERLFLTVPTLSTENARRLSLLTIYPRVITVRRMDQSAHSTESLACLSSDRLPTQ